MKKNEPPAIHFREDQQFRSFWLWFPLIFGSSILMGTVLYFIVRLLREPPAPDETSLPIWALLCIGAVLLAFNAFVLIVFAVMTLQTEVSDKGLFVRFYPLHRRVRMIDLDEVAKIQAVTFRPWLHYGGYGIRRLREAVAYTAGGDTGLRIDYENGCHLLIGTQYPYELEKAVRRVLKEKEGKPAKKKTRSKPKAKKKPKEEPKTPADYEI